MTDFFQFLLELTRSAGLKESSLHWVELGIILLGLMFSMGLGSYAALIVSWRQFRKRSFFDQMVIGVNTLQTYPDGKCVLELRTLLEDNLQELLDNPILEKMVAKAARRCTEDNPVIKLKDPEDHALLLTKIQNAISEKFAKEHLIRMFGRPFAGEWADFVVTCERYGGLKATKIRVLVFVGDEVRKLIDPKFFAKVEVEEPYHKDRLRTLLLITRKMHAGEDGIIHGRVEIPLDAL